MSTETNFKDVFNVEQQPERLIVRLVQQRYGNEFGPSYYLILMGYLLLCTLLPLLAAGTVLDSLVKTPQQFPWYQQGLLIVFVVQTALLSLWAFLQPIPFSSWRFVLSRWAGPREHRLNRETIALGQWIFGHLLGDEFPLSEIDQLKGFRYMDSLLEDSWPVAALVIQRKDGIYSHFEYMPPETAEPNANEIHRLFADHLSQVGVAKRFSPVLWIDTTSQEFDDLLESGSSANNERHLQSRCLPVSRRTDWPAGSGVSWLSAGSLQQASLCIPLLPGFSQFCL